MGLYWNVMHNGTKYKLHTVCVTSTLGLEQANEVKYLLAAHVFICCEL